MKRRYTPPTICLVALRHRRHMMTVSSVDNDEGLRYQKGGLNEEDV